MKLRRIALVCLTPAPDTDELGHMELPSYGIRRIQAAVAGDPLLKGTPVRLIDLGREDVEAYVQRIVAWEPEIVGFSIYVWSTPTLVAVAREVKRRHPSCTIVFGGPSARAPLFELVPYAQPETYMDVLVEGDGESTFRDIARLQDLSAEALATVPGLTLPVPGGFVRTAPRARAIDLDDIASPFQLGLMPRGGVAYLETYRGCPMSCRFCEWGSSDKAKVVFSSDYIARELTSFVRHRAPAVFLLDAGLNLNIQGFRNLRAAHHATGFLRDTKLWAEIYPSVIRDEHLAFLSEIGPTYLGVGMQSMDPAVLRLHQRPNDSPRFESAVRALAEVSEIELQIIFGLPGDTPEGFRRTLAYARSLPASVRAYHCLVLPDALMSRGLPEFAMVYDPLTLAMRSCLGWSETEIAAMRAELTAAVNAVDGRAGRYWWSFPRQTPHRRAA